jgi:hypothetical protein
MIELLSGFPENVLAFGCSGEVTREDYRDVVIPAVEAALKGEGKIRLFYRIGDDFSGIEPMAVWQDFKIGMEHLLRWDRVAVVTDVAWIANTMSMFGFMMPCDIRTYPNVEETEAREWIAAA